MAQSEAADLRLPVAALACAAVFVVALPFDHTTALRLVTLTAATTLAFATGGWRDLGTLPLRFAWLAWAGIAALSLVAARDFAYSLGELRNEVLYPFCAYAMWYSLARRHAGTGWLAPALAVAIVAALALGVAAFAAGRGPWFDLGKYGDVGLLTTFLIIVLPFLLLCAFRAPPHSPGRAGALVLAAGCLAAGFLALNRMFWLAAATEIILFALLTMRMRKARWRGSTIVAGIALVASLALAQVLLASQSRMALSAPGTGTVNFLVDDPRGDLWRFALARIAEHPWIGAGIGKWSMRGAFAAQFHDTLRMHAHNVFLNRALETGLPGLVAFAILLGGVGVAFWRLARGPDTRNVALGAAGFALVAGIIVKNLTDDFFVRQSALLFWSLAGAGLGAAAARRRLPGVAVAGYTPA